jgi:hypothetical protein
MIQPAIHESRMGRNEKILNLGGTTKRKSAIVPKPLWDDTALF